MRDMGIINASIDSGLLQEPFLPSRDISYIETRNSEKPYFQNVIYQPLVFDIVLAFEDGFSESRLREVRQWLSGDKFKELRFSDQVGRVYMAMCQDVSVLSHAGAQGYVSITLVTNSPYAMSDVVETEVYAKPTNVNIATMSDISIYPELLIRKLDVNGDVGIVNSTTGIEFCVNMEVNETIYVDNDKEIIHSNFIFENPGGKFNGQFLYLTPGENILNVSGDCNIKFRYRDKYLPHTWEVDEDDGEDENGDNGEGDNGDDGNGW